MFETCDIMPTYWIMALVEISFKQNRSWDFVAIAVESKIRQYIKLNISINFCFGGSLLGLSHGVLSSIEEFILLTLVRLLTNFFKNLFDRI